MRYKVNYDVPDAQVLYNEKKSNWKKMQKDKKVNEPIPPYEVPEPQSKIEIITQLNAAVDCLVRINFEDDLFKKDCARLTKKQQAIMPESAGLNELKDFIPPKPKSDSPRKENFLCANGFTINYAKETVARNVRASYEAQYVEILRKKQKKTSKAWKLGIGIAVLAYVAFFVLMMTIGFFADMGYLSNSDFVFDIFSFLNSITLLAGIIFVIVFALRRSKKADAEYRNEINEIEQVIIRQISFENEKIDREFNNAVRQAELENQRIYEENNRIRLENNRIFQYNNEVMERYMPENQRRAEIAWKQFISYEAEKDKCEREYFELFVEYSRDYSWLPKKYANIYILKQLLEYFENRLVDTLKEAYNYYEADYKHQALLQQMRDNAKAQIKHNEEWYRRFEQNQQVNQKLNEEIIENQRNAIEHREAIFQGEMWMRYVDRFENRRAAFDAAEYARTGNKSDFWWL